MKNIKIVYYVGGLIIVWLLINVFLFSWSNWNDFDEKIYKNSNGKIIKNIYEVHGDSMLPMLHEWSEYMLYEWYYQNWGHPYVGDIISYNYAWNVNRIIKVIKATFNDTVEIKENTLYINGRIMKNSVWTIYYFTPQQINVLQLYVKNGKIPQNSYLIFWDNTENSIDSRIFWAVSSQDFVGKFNINNSK